MTPLPRRLSALIGALALTAALAACGSDTDSAAQVAADRTPAAQATGSPSADASDAASPSPTWKTPPATPKAAANAKPLRPGERRLTVTMPEMYVPEAPGGIGTDDYRCFLLDPKLKEDSFITGSNILPGNPDVVHHVILFRVKPDEVKAARKLDREDDRLGWECFGNTGFGNGPQLDDAPWLAAWAPGGEERVVAEGYGTRLDKGSMVVMQVHYNLLKGTQPDISATQLRLRPASPDIRELKTILLPGPVELPCRKEHADNPLCDRDASLADTIERFGPGDGQTADLLYYLCGGKPKAGPTQQCTRMFNQDVTVRAAAGHMHLLGERITITLNPGTPQAKTILDISPWDFDDQGARVIEPISMGWADKVQVSCTHSQRLRDMLPAFETARDDRYVLWGEGTTDEMCLGILTVTTP